MLYGFSRDGAVPFSKTWTQVDGASGVPVHADVHLLFIVLTSIYSSTASCFIQTAGLACYMYVAYDVKRTTNSFIILSSLGVGPLFVRHNGIDGRSSDQMVLAYQMLLH